MPNSAAALPELAALLLVGCGNSDDSRFHGGSSDGGPSDGGVSGDGVGCLTCSEDGSAADGGGADGAQIVLPSNFVPTVHGGYALGPSLLDGGADAGTLTNTGSGCALVVGVVRDFKYANDPGPGVDHPDFGVWCCGVTKGLVLPTLDAQGKPQLAGICDQGNPDVTNAATCPGGQMRTTQT